MSCNNWWGRGYMGTCRATRPGNCAAGAILTRDMEISHSLFRPRVPQNIETRKETEGTLARIEFGWAELGLAI